MANIDKYLQSIAIGSEAVSITGDLSDAFKVGGYSAWVQSITDEPPTAVDIGNGKVKIILSQNQVAILKKWFENQLFTALKPKDSLPNVQYELGPVFKPLAIKYTIPVFAAILLSGYIVGKIL